MESSEVLAAKLLEFMGGKENIISVTHCATRLRPQLKDRSLVDADAIEKLDGVTGLVNKDSGLQIIIGMSVGDIYKAFMKVWDSERLEREGLIEKEEAGPKRHEWFNEFIALVVSIFSPLLPLLAGSGLLRGFTILANELGWLSTSSTTNLILTLTATSVFYFLPLLTAMTAAKRFQTSPYIAVAVMGALIMPDFLALVQGDGGNGVEFLGISIPVFNYTSQIIPAIIMTWLQSQMEHFMIKKIPNSLHMIIIPTVLLLVLVPITAGVIGPIGNYISIGVAQAVYETDSVREMLKNYVAEDEDIEVELPDYEHLEKPLVEVFTLDSATCAACTYMMGAANEAKKTFGDAIDMVEYKFTLKENIARCKKMGVPNLPSMYINGELKFRSLVPSKEELEGAIRAAMK